MRQEKEVEAETVVPSRILSVGEDFSENGDPYLIIHILSQSKLKWNVFMSNTK